MNQTDRVTGANQRAEKAPASAGIRHNCGRTRRTLGVALSAELFGKLSAASVRAGVSRSRYVAELLQEKLS
jgi:hypothetical protein